MKIDMVVDLCYGDSGKGKVAHSLLKSNRYTHVCRASGGGNCGHQIYHNGIKFTTHYIPVGVFYHVPSLVGAGCVVHPASFLDEIVNLERNGIPAAKYTKISSNAHIITDAHIADDKANDKIGSTGTGIAPVYRDKYARIGKRACDVQDLEPFVVDQYEMLMREENNILIEGAQGMWLCPDHGFYPYVTSSPPTVAYALHSLGLPAQNLNNVYGVCKAYETYVGTRKFQPEGEIYKRIAQEGQEYGSTTGRLRQVNFLDVDLLVKAMKMNGVTQLIVNKMDILRKLDTWFYRFGDDILKCDDEDDFISVIQHYTEGIPLILSGDKERI